MKKPKTTIAAIVAVIAIFAVLAFAFGEDIKTWWANREPRTQPITTTQAPAEEWTWEEPQPEEIPPTFEPVPTAPPAAAPSIPINGGETKFSFQNNLPAKSQLPAGCFYVVEYWFPGRAENPTTSYRYIGYNQPGIDFSQAQGVWWVVNDAAATRGYNQMFTNRETAAGRKAIIQDLDRITDTSAMAIVEVNPSAATATITLQNGNVITGNRHVENSTTFFTFYTDGSTASIRLKVPDNLVLVCTDESVIEEMDARAKSYIQSRQASPTDYFTKAYGGATVNLANFPNGKLDIWCAAD